MDSFFFYSIGGFLFGPWFSYRAFFFFPEFLNALFSFLWNSYDFPYSLRNVIESFFQGTCYYNLTYFTAILLGYPLIALLRFFYHFLGSISFLGFLHFLWEYNFKHCFQKGSWSMSFLSPHMSENVIPLSTHLLDRLAIKL